jgi:hypothetical protein
MMLGNKAGLWGQAGETWDNGDAFDRVAGVIGTSPQGASGVFGQSEATSTAPTTLIAGVVGSADTFAGVVGWSTTWNGVEGWAPQGTGVLGVSEDDSGVHGASTWQPGVLGASENNSGVMGISGPEGTQGPRGPIAGVIGSSDREAGVVGTSNAQTGLYGYSTTSAGLVAQSGNPATYAGVIFGNLLVNGNLYVSGNFNQKGCVVPFPDGTQRALYCMESPEVWFEDFGAARLRRGRAVVKLDADFAKVIKRGDYRVFLAAEGDCRGLYVRRKSAARFEVCELMGGKSSIPFSYRIVGRRKDVRGHKRFPRFDVPPSALRTPRIGGYRTRLAWGAVDPNLIPA